jgi:hypothetical protein
MKNAAKCGIFWGCFNELLHSNWLAKIDPGLAVKLHQLHGLEQGKISG